MSHRQITFYISICPTTLEHGTEGDMLDGDLLLAEIKRVAAILWPHCEIRFSILQIGHRQGDEFAVGWENGERYDDLADRLLESIDYSDEKLYL